MSLKWYKNAVLDETQEAYGKTWRIDKIENDGTIVFRCGKETALAPRTDKEYFSGVALTQTAASDPGCALILNKFNTDAPRLKELALRIATNSKVVQDAMSGDVDTHNHNRRVNDFADSLDAEPELKQMVVKAMRLSPVDIAIRKRNTGYIQSLGREVKSPLEGLPFGATLYIHDEVTWDRALTVEETLTVRSWCAQNWPGTFEIVCKLPDRRTGQEGKTVAKMY